MSASNHNLTLREGNHSCRSCDRPDDAEDMVACDKCDSWWHFSCVGVQASISDRPWCCPNCRTNYTPSSQRSGTSSARLRLKQLEELKALEDKIRKEQAEKEREFLAAKHQLESEIEARQSQGGSLISQGNHSRIGSRSRVGAWVAEHDFMLGNRTNEKNPPETGKTSTPILAGQVGTGSTTEIPSIAPTQSSTIVQQQEVTQQQYVSISQATTPFGLPKQLLPSGTSGPSLPLENPPCTMEPKLPLVGPVSTLPTLLPMNSMGPAEQQLLPVNSMGINVLSSTVFATPQLPPVRPIVPSVLPTKESLPVSNASVQLPSTGPENTLVPLNCPSRTMLPVQPPIYSFGTQVQQLNLPTRSSATMASSALPQMKSYPMQPPHLISEQHSRPVQTVPSVAMTSALHTINSLSLTAAGGHPTQTAPLIFSSITPHVEQPRLPQKPAAPINQAVFGATTSVEVGPAPQSRTPPQPMPTNAGCYSALPQHPHWYPTNP